MPKVNHLSFAIRRLDEVTALLERDRSQEIDQLLADYEAQMTSIAAVLSPGSTLSPGGQIMASQLIPLDSPTLP